MLKKKTCEECGTAFHFSIRKYAVDDREETLTKDILHQKHTIFPFCRKLIQT